MADDGRLTTHVLDTMRGCPAAGLSIDLFEVGGRTPKKMVSAVTNSDGRCDAPMLVGDAFKTGHYELQFHVGQYFLDCDIKPENGVFLDLVPVRFVIADASAHYHVPLLVSPYGYSTYRGS